MNFTQVIFEKWLCKDASSLAPKPDYMNLVFLRSKHNCMFVTGDISVHPVLIQTYILFINKIQVQMEMCGAMPFFLHGAAAAGRGSL